MNAIKAWLKRMRDTEPARWAELARLLLAVGVGTGWLVLDDETVNWIITGVALLASGGLTRGVRSSVYSKRTVDRLMNRPGAWRPLRFDGPPIVEEPPETTQKDTETGTG